MYKCNKTLRAEGESYNYSKEELGEYVKCSEDIIYFAEKYFKIVTIDRGEEVIKLYDWQKDMLLDYVHAGIPNTTKRNFVTKGARQIGKTTVNIIYTLWYSLFKKDKTVVLMSKKEVYAMELMKLVKNSYMELPLFLQQGVRVWNKKWIELENRTTIIASSVSVGAVQGQCISLMVIDEYSYVPENYSEDFVMSVFPTMTSGRTSQIIMTSSFTEKKNMFCEIYNNAVKDMNSFNHSFIKWDSIPTHDNDFKSRTINNIGYDRWLLEFEGVIYV